MDFHYRQLRAFLSVVDGGSLGRAAAMAHLSQPALSRLIGDMEARLGQRLFERHSRGMALTAAGEELVPHARHLLFAMQQAVDALDALRGLRRGTARIGAVATIVRSVLPPAIGRLIDEAPGLRVALLDRPDSQLLAALLGREIDLMIAPHLLEQEGVTMIAECRYDDSYTTVCATNHPLPAAASLADLADQRWVMPPRGATPRSLFEQMMQQAGAGPPEIAVETSSIGAMLSLVAQTRLLGWLPLPLVASEIAAGTLRTLDVAALTLRRRFFVYRRAQGLLPSAAARLLELLPLIAAPSP